MKYSVVESRFEDPQIRCIWRLESLFYLVFREDSSAFGGIVEHMIRVDSSSSQLHLANFHMFGFMDIIEPLKEILFLFEGGFRKIEYKCHWYKIKGIDSIFLAIVIDIFEEILLVAQFGMILEVVQWLSEDAIVDAILVFEAFVGLLPAHVDEHLFWGLGLDPAWTT